MRTQTTAFRNHCPVVYGVLRATNAAYHSYLIGYIYNIRTRLRIPARNHSLRLRVNAFDADLISYVRSIPVYTRA